MTGMTSTDVEDNAIAMPNPTAMNAGAVHAWDLGGAHVKVASADEHGRIDAVVQEPLALWRESDRFIATLRDMDARLPHPQARHLVTMTGELVDFFPDRASGVRELIRRFAAAFGTERTRIYAGRAGLLGCADAAARPADTASANWFASAQFLAGVVPGGVFVDTGSTTTDIVLLGDGEVRYRGYTDAERMDSEELVYLGAVRTPVAALARRVPLRGRWRPLMSELFANVGDALLLCGDIDEGQLAPWTADGGPASADAAAVRLARMLGLDGSDLRAGEAGNIARFLRETLLQRLQAALMLQLSMVEDRPDCLVMAGSGRSLWREIANRLDLEAKDFADCLPGLAPHLASSVADCAPVAALAQLHRHGH